MKKIYTKNKKINISMKLQNPSVKNKKNTVDTPQSHSSSISKLEAALNGAYFEKLKRLKERIENLEARIEKLEKEPVHRPSIKDLFANDRERYEYKDDESYEEDEEVVDYVDL